MALFGNSVPKETKEEKQEKKKQAILAMYGLQELSNPEDVKSVDTIFTELLGTGWTEFSVLLGGGNERDFAKQQMYYQRAIIEQNFIMIRQLDRIEKLLKNNQ